MEQQNKPRNKRAAFSRLTEYLRPYRMSVVIGITANISIAILGLVPPLFMKQIIDKIVLKPGDMGHKQYLLIWYGIAVLGSFLILALLSFLRSYIMHILGEKVILDLRKQVYKHLQTLSVSFFDSRQTGEIMSRVTNDTEVVEEFVNHAADTLISDAIRLIAMCIIMFTLSVPLAIVALVPVPVIFLLAFRFAKSIRFIYRSVRERLAEINAKVQENLSGIRVIKAFAREEHEYNSFVRDATEYYNKRIEAIRKWTIFFPSIDMVVRIGQVTIWVLGPILILNGKTTLGTLVVFTSYLSMLYEPVGNLARINDTIQRSLAAAERIFEIVDEKAQIQDAPNATEIARINGAVEFEHVDFSYENGDIVLKDICIHAAPGQIVALVGRSGAGKTSIVNLIPRFYDPDSGRILVDGVDIKTVSQNSLRKQMAMVLQDTFLFNGSVKDNIRYGRLDASDEEIIDAAKTANADEFIEKMPQAYDTEIGERGVKLSGGQKQRLAIARAVLADPRILILDEATSAVDSESEYLIHKAMDGLMEGRTTFVIAHRLSTIKHADQIVTLEDGTVSEVGDHKSLLDQDGVYAQMYEMQFRLNDELGR